VLRELGVKHVVKMKCVVFPRSNLTRVVLRRNNYLRSRYSLAKIYSSE